MSRYEIRQSGGVFDSLLGRVINKVQDAAAWSEYRAWLTAGNTPDPDSTPPPEANPALPERRARRLQALRAAVADRLDSTRVSMGGHTFKFSDHDLLTLALLAGSLAAGNALPDNFGWADVDGVFVPATGPQLVSLLQKVAERRYAFASFTWRIQASITGAADPDQVAVDDFGAL